MSTKVGFLTCLAKASTNAFHLNVKLTSSPLTLPEHSQVFEESASLGQVSQSVLAEITNNQSNEREFDSCSGFISRYKSLFNMATGTQNTVTSGKVSSWERVLLLLHVPDAGHPLQGRHLGRARVGTLAGNRRALAREATATANARDGRASRVVRRRPGRAARSPSRPHRRRRRRGSAMRHRAPSPKRAWIGVASARLTDRDAGADRDSRTNRRFPDSSARGGKISAPDRRSAQKCCVSVTSPIDCSFVDARRRARASSRLSLPRAARWRHRRRVRRGSRWTGTRRPTPFRALPGPPRRARGRRARPPRARRWIIRKRPRLPRAPARWRT